MGWFTVSGSHAAVAAAQEIVHRLRRQGLREGGTGRASEPGIVLVAGDDGSAMDALQATSGSGRVLVALTVSARVDPWRLLECGADDVVAVTPSGGVEHLLARLERWSAVDAVVESDAVRGMALG